MSIFCSALKSRLSLTAQGGFLGAGVLTKKGQGTRHLDSPRGSSLVEVPHSLEREPCCRN